jgi:small subunit ribosomal protein S17
MEENILNNIESTSSAVKSRKRILQGIVVSDKANKTITVKVERQVAHPLYKKYFKRSNKFMAHDENNDAREGDKVRIQ